MLTSKQRAEFRAQANSLETTLMVGKDGVTEAVVAEASCSPHGSWSRARCWKPH